MLNKTKLNKGFTLIELLVVIAIIGILAAIVLASLGPARNKAKNVRLKGELSQLRSTAELFYDNNGLKYNTGTGGMDTSCGTGTNVNTFLKGSAVMTALQGQADNLASGVTCRIGPDAYAIKVDLFEDNSSEAFWCADSNGFIGKSASGTIATTNQCD